jgi:hypothetical protein
VLQSLLHQLTRGLAFASIAALSLSFMPAMPAHADIAPDQGPGGSILVIKNGTNSFSSYYAEILRAEGFSFAVADLSTINTTLLNQYDVAVLGEGAITTAHVTTLTSWVNNGGNLITMRPDKKLANLLGLTDQNATLSEGYMLPNTAAAPGLGIAAQTMQYHGVADRYTRK